MFGYIVGLLIQSFEFDDVAEFYDDYMFEDSAPIARRQRSERQRLVEGCPESKPF